MPLHPSVAARMAQPVASGRPAISAGPPERAGQAAGLVVYLHGGGWVVGGLDDFDALARTLAWRSGCAVLLVDYRRDMRCFFGLYAPRVPKIEPRLCPLARGNLVDTADKAVTDIAVVIAAACGIQPCGMREECR